MLKTLIAERTVEVRRPLLQRLTSTVFGRPPSPTVMIPMVAEALVEGPTVGQPGGPTLSIDVEEGRARVVLDLGSLATRSPTTVRRVTLRERGTFGRMLAARFHIGRLGAGEPSPVAVPATFTPMIARDGWSPEDATHFETSATSAVHSAANAVTSARQAAGLEQGASPSAGEPTPYDHRPGPAAGNATASATNATTRDLFEAQDLEIPEHEAQPEEGGGRMYRPDSWNVRCNPRTATGTVMRTKSAAGALHARIWTIMDEMRDEARRLEEARDGTPQKHRRRDYDTRAQEYRHRVDALGTVLAMLEASKPEGERIAGLTRRDFASGGVVKPGRPYLMGEEAARYRGRAD